MRKWYLWVALAAVHILMIVFFVSVLEIPPLYTWSWKTVEISHGGTIRIPTEWTLLEQDGLIYVVDENKTLLMFESTHYMDIDPEPFPMNNAFIQDITYLENTFNCCYGNGAVYGRILTEEKGVQTQRYYLEIGYDRQVFLVAYNDRFDEKMMVAIAKTFAATDPLPV